MIKNKIFVQRKKSILNKKDKSNIGSWDKKIIPLCNKINKQKNYYTTSSCSGRVVIMIDQPKKAQNLFIAESHNKISKDWIENKLKKTKVQNVKLKCEPPILHVACENIESANNLLKKAKLSGLKHSGINSISKNIILEINASDRLELPLKYKNKIITNSALLEAITTQSNKKLERSWEKIKKFESTLE